MKNFESMFTNQQHVRELLIKLITVEPESMLKLSQKIGISPKTLTSFARDKKNVDTKRLIKIMNYLTDRGIADDSDKFGL